MNSFDGLGLNLGNLSRLSAAQTRSISAENYTGAKGAGGMATEVTLPPSMRWIPKGMSVRYLKKAQGVLHASARVPAIAEGSASQELHALVEVRNAADEVVFDADISMWVSPRQ